MSEFFAVTAEVRQITMTVEDIGHGWVVKVWQEPRVGRGKQRALLQLIDRFHIWPGDIRVNNRDALDEVLAQAVLQRRLPGLD